LFDWKFFQENLLLSSTGRVKVSDFGVSVLLDGPTDLVSNCSGFSPAFIAPELVRTNKTNTFSGFAADVWSLGVTLYFFVYGHPIFQVESVTDMYHKIANET
jgi:serine/threonine protein kinase